MVINASKAKEMTETGSIEGSEIIFCVFVMESDEEWGLRQQE